MEHPGLITEGYKNKQKRKLRIFCAAFTLAVLCLFSGIVCGKMSEYINNSDYDVLISTSTASSLEDKAASYKRAIEIYPERTSAYLYLLQAYEDEGRFSKSENDEFLALYNAHRDSLTNPERMWLNLNIRSE